MTPRRFLVFVLTAGLALPALTRAQDVQRVLRILETEPGSDEESKPKEAKGDETSAAVMHSALTPIFHLRDKGKVAGRPKIMELAVNTRYGKLLVPVDDLKKVRFGVRVDPTEKERIETLIQSLASEDFDEREKANEALGKSGLAALPLLRQALSIDNDDLKSRLPVLIAVLEAEAEKASGTDSLPSLKEGDDEIVTGRMTIRGSVLLDGFDIETRYGVLSVSVADLVGVDFEPAGDLNRKIEVSPNHQPPQNWLDTRVEVEKGQSLHLEASGQTNVAEWSVTSGPTGTKRYSGNTFGNFPMLALIGRIGKNGKPFLVGASHKSKVKSPGRLYLSVVPFQYNPGGVAGKYEVKVKIGAGG
jgi:hypothetical protein